MSYPHAGNFIVSTPFISSRTIVFSAFSSDFLANLFYIGPPLTAGPTPGLQDPATASNFVNRFLLCLQLKLLRKCARTVLGTYTGYKSLID